MAPERCDDVVHQSVTALRDPVVDDRDQAFYDDRRLTAGFSKVRAATLFLVGFTMACPVKPAKALRSGAAE